MRFIKAETENDFANSQFIRTEVFVKEQKVSQELEFDGLDSESDIYLALQNDKAAGVCRVRKTAEGTKIERFAVLSEYRMSGIGEFMLKSILEILSNSNFRIYLNAQEQVVSFYAKYGFKICSEKFWEAEIPHFQMELGKGEEFYY